MADFVPSSSNVPAFWPKIEFSLFLIGQILSMACYLFVFYHILFDKTARQSLQNHSILVLLLYNFLNVTINISLIQDYTRHGYVSMVHPVLCLIWLYVDFGIWYGAISLMLWISIERHVLIFHPNLVRTTRSRLFVHYIPLLISALYLPILYFYLVFLLPCNRIYINTFPQCGPACFYNVLPTWFNLYDSFVNYIIPLVLIVFFNVTLFIRFLKQKQRLRQAVTWRQCRKMLIQLILVSAVFLVCDLPYVVIFTVRFSGLSTFGDNVLSPYIMRLTHVPSIIVPYAALAGLSDLQQKLRDLCFWRRNKRTIAPITVP